MHRLCCISTLLCFVLFHSAAAFSCGPLAANAVFVVESSTGQPEGQERMVLLPLGRWNSRTRNAEPFYPEMKAPELEWMPEQLYTDCDYRLYDSRGRFVRSIHVDKWDANFENVGYYVLPGIPDLPLDGERYIATNVATVRESALIPTQLTHRQYAEAAKRVIPENLKAQSARGDGNRKPGPADFNVTAFRLGERVLSWWVGGIEHLTTLVEFGPAISVQSFPTDQSDPVSRVNLAYYPPSLVIDLDGDGAPEFLIETAHDGGGGFLFLSMRDGRWVASAETRTGGC